MAMINWAGHDPFDRLEQRMNQVFDHLVNPLSTVRRGQRSSSGDGDNQLDLINPAVDVYETGKGWNIHVELPGVKKEDIKIDASDNAVTLSAESKFSQDYNRDNVRYQERRFGTYSRTIPLPDSVDRDKIDANFKDGVLNLFLPKGEVAKPRKITVA
ncbi:HSP20-like chaperone [Linnemannia elongata AG-77]|uniref:HSP20-like chaperone n=1 Tax=Linnemannia elongata AG-77 TaxID=1314771 RepID=A0A197JAS4_9FUNG|nr:HSP20-like chaperone [Linnemannia elongata AG-77]